VVRLIYSMITSLDGYVADEDGDFSWAAPGEEIHAFVNELERPVGTYLYGRRMYQTMAVWESMDTAGHSAAVRDYAGIWRAADKVVYSRTLEAAPTARTRLERVFEPEAVRRLKASAARDISVGGPGLAAQAIDAGLVDEYRLLVTPVLIGGGTRALPDGVRLGLELAGERRLEGGVLYLAYRPA
jgi:dihydrofolate reductase